jgi:hypothetical protein
MTTMWPMRSSSGLCCPGAGFVAHAPSKPRAKIADFWLRIVIDH